MRGMETGKTRIRHEVFTEIARMAYEGSDNYERTLEELGDKVDANDKASIESAVSDLKEKNKGSDVAAIKASTEALQKAFYAVSEKLYQNAAPQQGQPQQGAANNGSNPDEPIDADYEEVKD